MRTLPQNSQCESTAGGARGAAGPLLSSGCVPSWGWENTTDPTGRRIGGSHLTQATNSADRIATGDLEPQARRPGNRLCRSGPLRVPALRLSLWLYFIRRSSPLQRLPSPRGYATHPPNRCVRKSKWKEHHNRHTLTLPLTQRMIRSLHHWVLVHSLWPGGWSDLSITGCWYTPSDPEDDQTSPSLGVGSLPLTRRMIRSLHHWVLVHNMYSDSRRVATLAFPFSLCFVSYSVVCCAFIINSSM